MFDGNVSLNCLLAYLVWLIWVYILAKVLWDCLGELMKTAYDSFHNFSNVAYENGL
jgi:hypothetical protein